MDAQRGIARRMVVGLPREGLAPAWEKDFAAYPPAGVILFARDFQDLEGLRRLTAHLRDLARPRRIFIAADEEGGFVSQLAGHLTVPPNAALLARGAEPGDVEWLARVTGERLRALGLDWAFAPVADIHSEPRNPVIGPRAWGTAPDAVAGAVAAMVRGLRAGGVATCLKHFPGHGDTVLDSHLALPRCDAPADRLAARELAPFRANLDADAVMTAHVVYPGLDPERPATFSPTVLKGVLRERLGFQGVCITDALEMRGAATGREPAEEARLALEAGCDLVLFAEHAETVRRARLELARMLADGALDRANFDAARPRLAALDGRCLEPSPEELGRPLEDLTPPGWRERLEAIVERGLEVVERQASAAGATGRPPAGPWSVREPACPDGATIRDELVALGLPVRDGTPGAVHLEAIASRVPLDAAERRRLIDLCRERPTVVVALQADEFLADLEDAALRVSACDPTALTRRVVARRLARWARGADRDA